MAKLNMLFYKLILVSLLGSFFILNIARTQGNCLVYPEASGERIACELSYRALEYPQGSSASQVIFDAAIKIGPNYAWAYYEKSVPFYKRGLLAEGVQLISKAIDLEPKNYLYYRAYWYFHHRSYSYCIKDLEELYTIHKATYASTPGGDMEMRLLLAMAYAQSGKYEKGIEWVEDLLNSYGGQEHLKGLYDYHCLGVIYYNNKQYDKALEMFAAQIGSNPHFADTYYYRGLTLVALSDEMGADVAFDEAFEKRRGIEGGYSLNIFEAYNVRYEDFEAMSASSKVIIE